MRKFFDLALSGSVTGAIYSMMAAGLVLTYSTSGIFNFAQAAVAFSVAYVYYQVHSGLGVPIAPALLLSVFVFAPLLGLALDRILLRRLATAPEYARIVGTIGLLVALPSLLELLIETIGIGILHFKSLKSLNDIRYGSAAPGIGPSPPHVYHITSGVALTSDQLAIFVVTAVIAAVLWFVLRHTRIGLDMRAVVDRAPLADLRGIDPSRTSAIAWILSMMLAGLGGILIAPLFTLDPNIFTLVVLSSLAAVVLAGLRSLPIAFVGGLAIGVTQNLVAGYANLLPNAVSSIPGLGSSVPYLLVVVLGLIVGRDRIRRAGTVAEERAPIDHRQGMSALRRRLPWGIATVALLAYSLDWVHVPGLHANSYGQTVIAQSLAIGIILLSYVIVTGMGGMVSLAAPTFATAGGFAAGWALNRNWGIDLPLLASHGELNFLWAAIIGALIGAVLGLLIALPATRLGAVYLAIWTLAVAFFFSIVVFSFQSIGDGQAGWTIRSPSLSVPGLNWLHSILVRDGGHFDFSQVPDQIVLFLVVFGIVTAVIHSLMRSSTGRAMLAVRSSQTGAQAVGIRANRTRIIIFAISSGVAGLGGVMLSTFSLAATNATVPPAIGLFWLVTAVVFGIRRPAGALLAGFSIAAGGAVLQGVAGNVSSHGTLNQLVSSPFFIPMLAGSAAIQLALEPDGILAFVGKRTGARRLAKERRAHLREASEAVHAAEFVVPVAPEDSTRLAADARCTGGTAVLAAEGVTGGYEDVEVLHGVSLALEPGRITALLGANGAGKSTLCSVLSGSLSPTGGRVLFKGDEATRWPAHRRAKEGLLCVPEARGIFPGLTVDENLAVLLRSAADRQRAYERFPILAERKRQHAELLSGGEQQMLGLAPALANPPAVLIADEVMLGLAPLVAQSVMDAILELRDMGTAVLLAEESAQNALKTADTIVVMELGRVHWSGLRSDTSLDRLGAAYLGMSSSA